MRELLEHIEALRDNHSHDVYLELLYEIAHRLYLYAVCVKDI
jgi:hypothetical protein